MFIKDLQIRRRDSKKAKNRSILLGRGINLEGSQVSLQNLCRISTADLLWPCTCTTIDVLIDTTTWRLIIIVRFVVIALFAAARLLIQSEEWLWEYRVLILIRYGSWPYPLDLVGELRRDLLSLILLVIEWGIGRGRAPAVSIGSGVKIRKRLMLD